MFKSALSYFSSETDQGLDENASSSSDRLIGSTLDVGGQNVRVRRKIGEGGFAFVYAVDTVTSPGDGGSRSQQLALKRLLAVDSEKRQQIVQEVAFLKSLKPCDHILQFYRAANIQRGYSATKCEEFLVLTELCTASMYDYLSARTLPYPAETVGRLFFQVLEAVGFMHRSNPPIAHRDLKIENLLVDTNGRVKLCDFGSATTQTYQPDESWNMSKRNQMEEEVAKFTTPMYRAPEMVDSWSNYPINCARALGCLLFQLCFHRHPFEDGAKLAIVNANFSIPESDGTHFMFHDLIRQMLVVDPSCRPTCQQVQEHLGEVGVLNSWDLEAKIDFER